MQLAKGEWDVKWDRRAFATWLNIKRIAFVAIVLITSLQAKIKRDPRRDLYK